MSDATHAEFSRLVSTVLARFFAQNSQPPPPAADMEAFAARLWATVAGLGLPPPLAPAERGEPGEMTDEELQPILACVLDGSESALFATAAKQLVKACFYPEFKTCRDSFRELDATGACRRQELARVRGRVSGSHCVDCPYWQTLTPAQHERFLARQWVAGPEAFTAEKAVWLPEDFRALRSFVRRQAASPAASA